MILRSSYLIYLDMLRLTNMGIATIFAEWKTQKRLNLIKNDVWEGNCKRNRIKTKDGLKPVEPEGTPMRKPFSSQILY